MVNWCHNGARSWIGPLASMDGFSVKFHAEYSMWLLENRAAKQQRNDEMQGVILSELFKESMHKQPTSQLGFKPG